MKFLFYVTVCDVEGLGFSKQRIGSIVTSQQVWPYNFSVVTTGIQLV